MEEIRSAPGELMAIIVRKDFKKEGINFISKKDFPLQLGVNSYKRGDRIRAHIHLKREIRVTTGQEIVYIKRGKAIVNLYNLKGKKFKSVELSTGDIIFFINGGHGFEMLEDTKIIEVKQGPYMGKDKDKRMIK